MLNCLHGNIPLRDCHAAELLFGKTHGICNLLRYFEMKPLPFRKETAATRRESAGIRRENIGNPRGKTAAIRKERAEIRKGKSVKRCTDISTGHMPDDA